MSRSVAATVWARSAPMARWGGAGAAAGFRRGGEVLAGEEECGFPIVLGQHVEQVQRVRVVGAVVVGERELFGVGEAMQRLAEEPRLGRDSAVTGHASGG